MIDRKAMGRLAKNTADEATRLHIEGLEEALRWYADRSNYGAKLPSWTVPIRRDFGKRARDALGEDNG